MLYGEPPTQGFIRGRVFAHPVLRISFEVPAGYQLFDTQKAVYALGPDAAMIIFDTEPRPGAFQRRTMLEYLRGAKPPLAQVATISVTGLEAATGSLIVNTGSGRVELRLAVIRINPTTICRFRFLTPVSLLSQLGSGNIRTLQGFRILTVTEATALKPLRVRVISVQRGDSVVSVAKRMIFEQYAVERFRVLNGLGRATNLSIGQRVKIVTE